MSTTEPGGVEPGAWRVPAVGPPSWPPAPGPPAYGPPPSWGVEGAPGVPPPPPPPAGAGGGAPGWAPPPAWGAGSPGPGTPPPEWGSPQWGPSPGAPSAPPSVWVRFRQRFDEAPVTVSIVVLTVAVWLVHLGLQRWAGINTDLSLGDNGSGIHGQWWRLLTPMVVHFGVLHIGLNMFMLWQLGPAVEKVIGRRLYLLCYLVCGIAGGVLSDIMYKATVLSGGASGAIVGIVGVLIGNTVVTDQVERWGRRSTQQWRFNPKVARSLGIQIVLWIAFTSVAIKQIDNWAHIGGGVAGLLIGAAVAWSRTEPVAA